MNRKIVFQLSLFGLVMGFATISLIPQNIEPLFWLIIFIISAYLIAKNCAGKYFMHGFFVSLLNSFWITFIHIIFFEKYLANHSDEILMMSQLPLPYSPRIVMLMAGIPFGVAFGLILGLFAFFASKIVKRKNAHSN